MKKLLLVFLFGIGMHFCYAQQSGTPAGTAMPQTQAWVSGTGTTGTLSLYFGSSQYFQVPTYKQFLDSLLQAIKYADTTSKIETRYHALHTYQPLLTGLTFGTTGTDPAGSVAGGVLTINLPTMAQTGVNFGLLNNTTQTIPGAKTFSGGLINTGNTTLGNSSYASANLYVAQTYANATLAKFLFGGATTSVARTWVGGGTNAVVGASSNYAGTLLADNPVSVATGITVPIASQLAVKNFTLALTGTAAITEKDGLYLEAQKGGINNYSMHALGKVKIDQHAVGVAGTDSLLVSNGGEVKAIPANYYAPAVGLSGYVPYTGATGDVNLGAHAITVNNSAFGNTGSFISNGTYTDPSGGFLRDFYGASTVAVTTAPAVVHVVSATFQPTIGANNTQNWTAPAGGLIGLRVAPGIASGASGTIAKVIGIENNIGFLSSTASVTNWDMFSSIMNYFGTIANTSYMHLGNVLQGTNTAFMLYNWPLAGAYPTGHWFLYNNSSETNYLGTGATLINTTTDNGVDKLQITGGLLANGQAHYGAGRTLGALDFMYKQKADSLYTAKTDQVTFSTGLTNTANMVTNNLSTGVAGGQIIVGGTAAADSLVIRPNLASTMGFALRPTGATFSSTYPSAISLIAGTVKISDSFLNGTGTTRSFIASSFVSNTGATSFSNVHGAFNINVPATSTGPLGNVTSMGFSTTVTAGATSTISSLMGTSINVSNNSTGATITNLTGQRISVSGLATNITGLQLTSNGASLPGNWSIYNGLTYANYLGTGATLINTTTDNGVDKLQITGGLLANGQAHYGAGRTLGALDFMYQQKADSLYAPVLSAISSVVFGTTGTDPAGSIASGVLTINLPTMAQTGANFGLLTNGAQTLPGIKTFSGGIFSSSNTTMGSTNPLSANLYIPQTYGTANIAKFLIGTATTIVSRSWVGGTSNAVIGTASNYAGTLLADNPVSVATGITVPIASQLAIKNFTPALTGTAAITEKDGLYLEAQKGGVNNYSIHSLGKVKIDQYATGTAGTDSLLVSNGGEIKAIPANYYAAATGLTNYVPYTGANADVNLGAHSIIAANSLALPNNASFLSNGVYNNPTNIIRDYASQSSAVATTGPNNTRLIGAVFTPSIGAANTQNWTVGAGAVVGVISNPSVASGASGTINRIIGLSDNVFLSSNLATVTYWDMLCSNVTNSGTIVNSSYIHTTQELPGGNTAFILHNWSLTAAYPTGHWFLYNNTSDINYLGTGATLINTTTDNGVDKLQVNGTIHAKGVKVDLNFPAPDYVFDADYKLASLPDVKKYIDENHHLAEIPSAQQIAKEGIDLGEMNAKLLKKVEELTLYLIQKDEEIKVQRQELIKIKKRLHLK